MLILTELPSELCPGCAAWSGVRRASVVKMARVPSRGVWGTARCGSCWPL